MGKDDNKNTLAAALLVNEPEKPEPVPAAAPDPEEKPPRKTRKSDIIRDPLKGASGAELKKKRRKRRGKPAELKKSHSFTVLMTEQMYQKFKTITEYEGVSMNGVITKLLRKYIIAHDIDDDMLDIF